MERLGLCIADTLHDWRLAAQVPVQDKDGNWIVAPFWYCTVCRKTQPVNITNE